MQPYYKNDYATIYHGDCREVLRSLPDGSVNCCVTSPPYFGLRDYGVDGQIGLEPTPEEYVAQMVSVFREVRRVLRDDGALWLNLGDSYAGSWGNYGGQNRGNGKQRVRTNGSQVPNPAYDGLESYKPATASVSGLKPKDLIGIPWRVAFALQADGWWLRQDIIWSKPNPMPESVTDRCTKAHEYVFLLTKSARYFYDAEAVKEECTPDMQRRAAAGHTRGWNGRNRRSVWTISTTPYSGAHFATMPPDLVEPCILAGTSERGCCPTCGKPWERVVERTAMVLDRSERTHERGRTRTSETMLEPPISATTGWRPSCECGGDPVPCIVLDPFLGSGTTIRVANTHRRIGWGIELNPQYIELVQERISHNQVAMF